MLECEDHWRILIAINKRSLIIETEDMGCQAVDTIISKRETATELPFLCVIFN